MLLARTIVTVRRCLKSVSAAERRISRTVRHGQPVEHGNHRSQRVGADRASQPPLEHGAHARWSHRCLRCLRRMFRGDAIATDPRTATSSAVHSQISGRVDCDSDQVTLATNGATDDARSPRAGPDRSCTDPDRHRRTRARTRAAGRLGRRLKRRRVAMPLVRR